ncbi:MAG TPA: RsmD family RNA methyltransferase [Fluviicola sp.]|nr:RsmD family RNA methyltransferase [Fluviicola sp.]
MRIVRGIYKARRFNPPKNFPSRPTTDFAKEGIFNMLENKFDFVDLEILDLCAGTGNISLEFLSREAGNVTSVDMHPVCTKFMSKLKHDLGIENEWSIVRHEARGFLDLVNQKYDLIFSDPPYDVNFHAQIIQKIKERNVLNENGLCVIEHGKQTDLTQEPGYIETRNFGNVFFSFFH